MTIEILKETLIETGNPFVWITDAGWFFNEQSGSVKYTAEQVLNVETFEDLAKIAEVKEPTELTADKTAKKKK
jgi:hypothetical protein